MPNLQPAQSTDKPERDVSHYDEERRRRNQFLKAREVAKRLGMSVYTLKGMWAEGKGPRLRILSPRVQGSTVGDVEDFLEASIVT
jgi:predicted DNA-binding transcriptional regulator AlpA